MDPLADPVTTEDRIGTMNVLVTLGPDAAEAALRLLFREGVELAGLQEWSKARDGLLEKLDGHIEHGRGDKGGGPLVWNATRYGLARKIRTKTLVGGGFVGRLPGRRSKLGPSYATVGVFHDEVLGGRVTLVNAHLTAEVQDRHGNYHRDRPHRARVRRHKAEVRALRLLVLAHRLRGNRPYVVLDGNFDGLTLSPLVSCWKGRPGGTLGGRAVDIVFGPEAARDVKTLDTRSDHHAVVAVYTREN